jgi:hypothetical protein
MLENTFQKLGLFLFSWHGDTNSVESLRRNLPEILDQFLEFWTTDEIQTPSNSECHTPWLEPFIFYFMALGFISLPNDNASWGKL